ncbi:hypothetical protein [Ruegeria sp. THAF33]|uniref:hypothetical protein n=1 Tax=Ruegeria sp. THAF33 TaxID=2587853 RepID=UPI001268B04F|nr:hypothetical protein [Ruegeria sp. THAF33]QFT75035.1 hypothetical protein FIU92_18495 [Ruegeria sp. THAF33]
MKDNYDIQTAHAATKFQQNKNRQEKLKRRNGIAAMAAFAPLWSAADPRSKLYQFKRLAPLLFLSILIVFVCFEALS